MKTGLINAVVHDLLLFEINATDPVVYGLPAIGLILAALGAALIPAIRASRHNPVTLLSFQ